MMQDTHFHRTNCFDLNINSRVKVNNFENPKMTLMIQGSMLAVKGVSVQGVHRIEEFRIPRTTEIKSKSLQFLEQTETKSKF